MAAPKITVNRARQRFEATVGGALAGFAAYEESQGTLVFTHTEVDPAYQGQGVAGALVRYGLDQARQEHLRVVPRCPFVAGWITRHPDYADLTSAGGT